MPIPIDFDRIAETQDLPAMLRAEGIEIRNGKALCPFHDNTQTPALSVYQRDGRWRFRCHSCPASGDAITWRSMRNGITTAEAARELGHLDDSGPSTGRNPRRSEPAPVARPTAPPRPAEDAPGHWADPAWQVEAEAIIARAELALWSPDGAAALAWLRARGLRDSTIRRFRLGFLPEPARSATVPALGLDDRGRPRRIFAPRGITIPWFHPAAGLAPDRADGPRWVGCNVRRLAADPFEPLPDDVEKCMAFAGSHRGYPYPTADVVPGRPLLLVEGEWDCLIARQELGWIVNVATTGGTKGEPKRAALDVFTLCPNWLLAMHNDDAGNESAKRWAERAGGKGVRALMPPGRDLNEMHLDGIDLRSWLRGEFVLFGWRWDDRAAQRWGPGLDDTEATVEVPAESWRWGVATWLADRWLAWHRRAGELAEGKVDAPAILAAQHAAYAELADRPRPDRESGRKARALGSLAPGPDGSDRGDAYEGDLDAFPALDLAAGS